MIGLVALLLLLTPSSAWAGAEAVGGVPTLIGAGIVQVVIVLFTFAFNRNSTRLDEAIEHRLTRLEARQTELAEKVNKELREVDRRIGDVQGDCKEIIALLNSRGR